MADEFDKLIPDFLALARRIFEAGMEAGQKAERDRLLSLIQPSDQPPANVRPPLKRRWERSTHHAGYGDISRPVLRGLRELAAESPEGVPLSAIVAYVQRQDEKINELQVRASVKHLFTTGRLLRPDRGLYLPLDRDTSGSEEVPGSSEPGPLLAAAE